MFFNISTKGAFPSAKIPKNGSKRYLMFGPKHVSVTMRWDDVRSPGDENVSQCFLNRYK